MSDFGDRVQRAARGPAAPILRYFNTRFEDVHGHLDNQTEALTTAVEVLRNRVATDVEVISELALTIERFADRFADRMDEVLVQLGRSSSAVASDVSTRRATLRLTADDNLAGQAPLLDQLHEWLTPDGELELTLPSAATDTGAPILERWELVERREPADDGSELVLLRLVPRR